MAIIELYLDELLQNNVTLPNLFTFKYRDYHVTISGLLYERNKSIPKGMSDMKCFKIDLSAECDDACHDFEIARNQKELDAIIDRELQAYEPQISLTLTQR